MQPNHYFSCLFEVRCSNPSNFHSNPWEPPLIDYYERVSGIRGQRTVCIFLYLVIPTDRVHPMPAGKLGSHQVCAGAPESMDHEDEEERQHAQPCTALYQPGGIKNQKPALVDQNLRSLKLLLPLLKPPLKPPPPPPPR